MTTSMRVALLHILLALGSSFILLGFIHLQTRDDALAELRRLAVAEAKTLVRLYDTGNRQGFRYEVEEALSGDDPELLLGVFDHRNRLVAGNISAADRAGAMGFETGRVTLDTGEVVEAGLYRLPLKGGGLLISGRSFDEKLTLQRTLQRSLVLAVVMSVLLGLGGAMVLTRYVGQRIGDISLVADAVGEGDLGRRVPVAGERDAFDRLAVQINHMLDRIQSLMDELRLLTDSLAHDLRSPVSRLRARIERALTVADEDQRDAELSGVMQEADALMRMLTVVLEIGRSEAMAGRKQFEALNPAGLMAELAEMYAPLAEEAEVRLTVNLPDPQEALSIDGHRQLLAQAISNLIDNALKYGSAGGEVELAVGIAEHDITLVVGDHGGGIAPEDEAEARRRFGRLDQARSSEGAGLGLALVDTVARLHGGRMVLADNQPGLRAMICLPFAK